MSASAPAVASTRSDGDDGIDLEGKHVEVEALAGGVSVKYVDGKAMIRVYLLDASFITVLVPKATTVKVGECHWQGEFCRGLAARLLAHSFLPFSRGARCGFPVSAVRDCLRGWSGFAEMCFLCTLYLKRGRYGGGSALSARA